MLNAAIATIDLHGKENVGDLLPVFEDFLDNGNGSCILTLKNAIYILTRLLGHAVYLAFFGLPG